MRFKKGTPKPPASGRKSGTPNKHNGIFKTAVANVFREGGGEGWLLKWAKRHPTEFFQIAARLAPREIAGDFSVMGGDHSPVHIYQVALPDNGRGPRPGETVEQFQDRTKATAEKA